MNISMVVLNPFTHDARVMKEAQTLQAHGHQVTVNALWAPGLLFDDHLPDGIRIQRIHQRSREGIHIPLLPWLELILKLTKALIRQRPDVCHAHDLNALLACYLGLKLAGARLVYDSHELETGRNSGRRRVPGWKLAAWKRIEGFLARQASGVLTVSPSIASELSRLYSIPEPSVVRNCPKMFTPPPTGRLRLSASWPAESPVVLYQGGLLAGRGLEPLLRAVAQLPEVHLAILGDGPCMPMVQKLVLELRIQDRIFLPGKVAWEVLLEYTCDGDLGTCLIENVCRSYYYSLPNKLFEYLMAGVPVLASDFPDLRQVVLEAQAGYVVDPSNPEKIAAALRSMLSDRVKLAEMAANARRAASENYNWEKESQKLLAVYQEIFTTS
jgi:glycosyltransferase involved in cell wall biosynthesis